MNRRPPHRVRSLPPALGRVYRGGVVVGALTKELRDRLTPAEIIEEIKKGNDRFRAREMIPRDYMAQERMGAAGQFPAAVALGCIDSRAPVEIVFDVGIGAMFTARIAGSVVNDDIIGSMEYACAVAGAKVVLLLGHTGCGAIKSAIDDVDMGSLTGLLGRIKPAIAATNFSGDKSSKNAAYVNAVARANVLLGLDNIRARSPVLAALETKGSIKIIGGMFDVGSGRVEFVG